MLINNFYIILLLSSYMYLWKLKEYSTFLLQIFIYKIQNFENFENFENMKICYFGFIILNYKNLK